MLAVSHNKNRSHPISIASDHIIPAPKSSSSSPPLSWQTEAHGKWLATRYPHDLVIADMARNPAPTRIMLDAEARDEELHFNENQLSALLFTADSDPRCLRAALSLASDLYQTNTTFRRLLNHFSSTSAGHANQCKLAAGDVYSMTVTDEQIAAAGEKLLTIVLDQDGHPSPAGNISAQRAMTHELLHHITHTCDDNSLDNPRGTIVEYTNIVLANREPAREAYGERSGRNAHSPEGVGERFDKEHDQIWNFVRSTTAGWREQAINTIKSLPEAEIAMLHMQLPHLDRMLREASQDNFADLHREVVAIFNKLENPSQQLFESCNAFESKRREINTKISLAETQTELLEKREHRNAEKSHALTLLASVSGNDFSHRSYKARCTQGDLEQTHRMDRDRAARDHKSAVMKVESTMDIAARYEMQPRKMLVTVATEYEVKTTRGTVLNDPLGRTAHRPHGLKAVGNATGVPLNTNAPSHVKTVKTETPTIQKYVVTEDVRVTANADGKFSTRDLKTFAGTGSNHNAVVISKNSTGDGIEIIKGEIRETARGKTSYGPAKMQSFLVGPSFPLNYMIEEKKHYLTDLPQPGSIARHTDTSLMRFSEPDRNPARRRDSTALAIPAQLPPLLLSLSAQPHTIPTQINVISYPRIQASLIAAHQDRNNMTRVSRTPITQLVAPDPALKKRPSSLSPALAVLAGAEAGAGAGAGRLAAYSLPTVIALPMEGVTLRTDGSPEIKLNGYQFRVTFDHDAGAWRTADGASRLAYDGKKWRRLAANEAIPLQRTGAAQSGAESVMVTLPSIRTIPGEIKPLPKDIHYTWIGGSMSEINIKNIIGNAQQSFDENTGTGYRTILHVDANSPAVHAEIAAHFDGMGINVIVENLRASDFFKAFAQTKFGRQYEAARHGKYPCYAAASDVLRYQLINHAGGVYIDVDDTIHENIAFSDLPASSSDLLLHELASNAKLGMTDQFGNSTLGSHANNPLLNEISERSHARFREDPSFFDRERPYLSDPESADSNNGNAERMKTYAQKISAFAGPALLDAVLRERAPDAYNLRNIENALNSITLPSDYREARTRSHEHYHPFGALWNITPGRDHSWQST